MSNLINQTDGSLDSQESVPTLVRVFAWATTVVAAMAALFFLFGQYYLISRGNDTLLQSVINLTFGAASYSASYIRPELSSIQWYNFFTLLGAVSWIALFVLVIAGALLTRGFTRVVPRWPLLSAGPVAVGLLVITMLRYWAWSIGLFGSSDFAFLRNFFWPPTMLESYTPALSDNRLWLYVGVLAPVTLLLTIVTWLLWISKTSRPPSPSTSSLSTSDGAVSMSTSDSIAPGWYPDPDGKPADRYWDGTEWTPQTRPASAQRAATSVPTRSAIPGYNVLAIIAFVSAFVIPLILPIVLGGIARGQIRRTGEQGAGLALAAVILGWIFTVFFILYVALVVLAISNA